MILPDAGQERTGEIQPENIPDELKSLKQWVNWAAIRSEDKEGFSKPPMKANGRNASSTKPGDWTTLEKSLAALGRDAVYTDSAGQKHQVTLDGIGLAGLGRTGYTGIDLDHCVNSQTGEINPAALKIVEHFDSYTEITPSGEGLRIWIEAEKPPIWSANKAGETDIEVYDKGRFFTVTGRHLEGTRWTVEKRQEALDAFMVEHAPEHAVVERPEVERRPYTGPEGYVLDLDRFLEEFGVQVLKQASDTKSERAYHIICPWAHEHSGGDTSGTKVGQFPSGAPWFKCWHAHCVDAREWEQFREELDPEAYRKVEIMVGGKKLRNDSNDSAVSELRELPDPKRFPVEVFPPSAARLVREAAAAIGCPDDFLAVGVLASMSAAIGGTREILIKKGWTEGAAVYAMIVGGPASKKSPALREATKPVLMRQLSLKAEHERRCEEHEIELDNCGKDDKKPEKPVMGRTYVDDATIEKLADILKENQRGVALIKDELSGWLGSMDQYKQGGKGGERQKWLQIHTNHSISVDRKSSEEPVIIPRPFVSIFGGIQPEVLPDFGKDRGDGLIDRFIAAYPEPVAGRWTDSEISDGAREGYKALIDALYRLEPAEYDGGEFASRVEMSGEGKAVFIQEYNKLHAELESLGFPQRLRPVYGKLEAYLARFALILSMARGAQARNDSNVSNVSDSKESISREDMEGAVKLLTYFKNHARRVYTGLYADSSVDRLKYDMSTYLIDKGNTWEGTASELHTAFKSEYKPARPEDLAKAVRAMAKQSSSLRFEDLKRTSDSRTFRLTLGNAVIAVTAVIDDTPPAPVTPSPDTLENAVIADIAVTPPPTSANRAVCQRGEHDEPCQCDECNPYLRGER